MVYNFDNCPQYPCMSQAHGNIILMPVDIILYIKLQPC